MKKIFYHNGILYYYSNPAGYRMGETLILDSIFAKEDLIAYLSETEKLSVKIRDGVYDRLSEGGEVVADNGEKRIRIYQLKQDSPILMRFVSLAERKRRGFAQPQKQEYVLVYEGEVEDFQLEKVWEKFGRKVPDDFRGHALSISDVVEFSDGETSLFFYVEPKGFANIEFQ